MRTIVLEVDGMTCGGCETVVVRALVGVPGVARARAEAARRRAEAEADGAVGAETLIAALRAAGFAARPG